MGGTKLSIYPMTVQFRAVEQPPSFFRIEFYGSTAPESTGAAGINKKEVMSAPVINR